MLKISKTFSIFYIKNNVIAMDSFNILKKFISTLEILIDAQRYPPEYHRRIYPHKLFICCILNIILEQAFLEIIRHFYS